MPVLRSIHTNRGFSIVELMVAVVILGIIAGIGLPSFLGAIQNSRLNASANDVVDALRYARSEAVQRNAEVGLTAGGNYAAGWSVEVIDTNELLRSYDGFGNGVSCDDCTGVISFNSRGMLVDVSDAGNLEVEHTNGNSRCITLTLSGGVNIANGGCGG